jgi:hypothetical protein
MASMFRRRFGLRHRALIGLMVYSFARVGAALRNTYKIAEFVEGDSPVALMFQPRLPL